MKGRPSTKMIIGGAVALFGCVLMAIAIHRLLSTGTCSSTGYTEYGPAPKCPSGTGWYSAFLFAGVLGSIGSAFVIGSNVAIPGLFVAIGVGSLLVGLSPHPKIGAVFPLVFGGCFAVAGVAWGAVAGAYAWNARPIAPRAAEVATPGLAIAGLGPAPDMVGRRLPRLSARPLLAVAVWAAVVVGALELGALVARGTRAPRAVTASPTVSAATASASAPAVDITRAPLPRPTRFAGIGPTSPASLFRSGNLEPVLQKLTARFGADGSVVALAIYPGALEAVLADAGNDARLVIAPSGGPLVVGSPVSFDGSRQAVNVSQLHADVPQRLASQITRLGHVPTARLDRFELDLSKSLASWKIYPAGGIVQFRALLSGDNLERVTPRGTQSLA